ncbi:MAG: hypothetical protein GY716_15995 [bacterium]|nr:hypothetical protein [bacterium]
MPIYEYECDQCGRRLEEIRTMRERGRLIECGAQLVADPPIADCQGKLRPQVTMPSPPQGDFPTPKRHGR